MHLPVAVHRHPRPGDHPHHPEPGDALTDRVRARNVTRGTDLATDVEVASSLWAKFLGLMGRDALPSGAGLWLPDSNGIHMMFMRFPIDVIFVGRPGADGSRPVVSVHRAVQAWTGLIPLIRGAHGVLELPVGAIDASATVVGDEVAIG